MTRGSDRTAVARPDQRRAELLDAARRVIRRSGLGHTTVGQITREAGASLGLLHYHFASKEEVVVEAFAAAAGEETRALQDIARRHADPPTRLAAYLELVGVDDRESWRMWVDAWGEAVHAEVLRCTLREFQRGWRSVLADLLADGDRGGFWRCPDPDDAAARLVAALDGVALHATLHPEDVASETASAWARRLAELELGCALPGAPATAPPGPPPAPYEARIAIRGRDLDATGRVHPAVLLTYLGEAREAWLEARLGALGPLPRLEVAHVTADFRHVPARRDAEVVVRCALDGLGDRSVRTLEQIETVARTLVVSAGATVVVDDEHGEPRRLTDAERQALLA